MRLVSLTASLGQAPDSPLMICLAAPPVQLSNAAVDQLVAEIGADRILAALDRVTQPQLPLAAKEVV
jgi:hypothetical protein